MFEQIKNYTIILLWLVIVPHGYVNGRTFLPASVVADSPQTDTYRRLLDQIFPRYEVMPHDNVSGRVFSLTLRFSPSFGAESQINLIKYYDGKIDCVLFTAGDDKSVWTRIIELEKATGRDDLEYLIKSIPVKRQVIDKPHLVYQRLLARFAALRFSQELEPLDFNDPATYELWYKAGSNQSSFSLIDKDPGGGTYRNPLVRWMNEVYRTVR